MEPQTALCAGIFGFPAAPGFVAPQEHVPDAWLLSFLEEYTDGAVWWGVFRSCRAGRDYVLRRAKSAALTLDAQDSQPFDKWRQQLRSTQLALSTRGLLPSSLTLSGAGNDIRAQLVPGALMGVGAGTTHLFFKPSPPDDPARSALLKDTVAALTGLQSLQLWSTCAIPPPSLLPKLTALTAFVTPSDTPDNSEHVPHEQLGRSIGAVVSQLQSLSVDTYSDDHIRPSQLFNHIFAQGKTRTLTQLSCDAVLTDALLSLLLDHAPSLTHLSVYNMAVYDRSGTFGHRKWRLEQLDVQHEPSFGPVANFPFIQLSQLPKSTYQGRVKASFCKADPDYAMEMCIGRAYGMDKTILKRFRDYELTHGRVYIDSCETIDGDDMAPGLRSILRAMADYQGVEGQVVDLTHKWGWAASWPWARELPGELCAVVSECVPLLTHLKIGVCFKALDDNHLSAAYKMGPHLYRVSAPQLSLQSDQHADKEWLWPVLALTGEQTTDMTSLLKLPKPSTYKGEGKPVLATGGTWNVNARKADAERLIDWLSHVQWSGEPTFTLPHTPLNLPLLSTQLSVLRAVRLSDTDTQQDVTVQPSKWPLCVNTMALLQGLPAWCGALDLTTCTLPLKPTQYTQLASHVPTTYTRWLLGARLSDARINAICDGVNQRRAGLGLQPLRLVAPSHEGRDRRVGEHVIVSSRAEGGFDGADSSGGGSDESEGYSSDTSDMKGEGEEE